MIERSSEYTQSDSRTSLRIANQRMTSSKVAPYLSAPAGGEPLEVLNVSQRTNDSADSQQTPPPPSRRRWSKNISKVKGSIAVAGVASRKRSEPTTAASNSTMAAVVDYRSERGHDLDGGGLHVGHGQLEQAKDRNFQAVLDRCRVATKSLAALRPVVCVVSSTELQGLVSQVAGMLAYLEHLFHENTKKTIVSLKQLCSQLEAADQAAAPFGVAPSFCSRLCGGAGAAEKAGNVVLQEKIKAVRTYAVSLLLEHGFQASDLAEFATGSQRKPNKVLTWAALPPTG